MITVDRVAEMRRMCDRERAAGRRVGFVPTMGALHEGHLSLIRAARAEADTVVVSIFVNPTQFGPGEDIDSYPRSMEADLAACEREGVDIVFRPSSGEMYPRPPATRIVVSGVSGPLEGEFRPGHFEGVALVCTKLFNAVGPCRAYFGEKDAQQLRVVRRLVEDLCMPVEVVDCPTVRDPDGIALSSRNAYLTPDERERARALSRALFAMADRVAAGERRAEDILAHGREVLARGRPDAVDYLAIVDGDTFEPVEVLEGPVLACGAIHIGKARLIDNVALTPPAAAVHPGRTQDDSEQGETG